MAAKAAMLFQLATAVSAVESKQAFAFEPASSGNAITFSGDQGKNFINLSESSKVQSTTSGFEVFEDVLGRLKFTVDGSSVPLPTKSTISNQDNFDNFFENNYDPANNNYRINFLASGKFFEKWWGERET